ncbi:MAG: hypothetical protein QM658_07000 [Gordonia sp. (in: high G+C Gram-positive bacteria)]
MTETVSEARLWLSRAAVAGQAAEELDGLANSLQEVLRTNYFGVDCVEGLELFTCLQGVFLDVADEIRLSASAAKRLMHKCGTARDGYEQADSRS